MVIEYASDDDHCAMYVSLNGDAAVTANSNGNGHEISSVIHGAMNDDCHGLLYWAQIAVSTTSQRWV